MLSRERQLFLLSWRKESFTCPACWSVRMKHPFSTLTHRQSMGSLSSYPRGSLNSQYFPSKHKLQPTQSWQLRPRS